MKMYVMIGLVLTFITAISGCVSKKEYMAAVAESEAVKTDLEKTRSQKAALEQQVKSLKDANAKMSADAEFVAAELQRIKDSREKERASIDTRTKELEQKIKDLSAQHRALRQEYEDVKKHNETLKATVARYQKELKERERTVTLPSPPSLPRPPATAAPAPGGPTSKLPGTQAGAQAEPTPPQPGMAPVNINTASASDLVLFLGVTKEMADRIVANRPYKIKGELVAKQVLPKGTFDSLKDRITVAP